MCPFSCSDIIIIIILKVWIFIQFSAAVMYLMYAEWESKSRPFIKGFKDVFPLAFVGMDQEMNSKSFKF